MKYLLERASPPLPGLPRPRFSLYLSSQLQYGVIVVYHRQCSILLGKKALTGWRKPETVLTQMLNMCLCRGASVCGGPAAQTEDLAENWLGCQQQVRTGAQHFTRWSKRSPAAKPPAFFQTTSGPDRRPVSAGGGRGSSWPFVWRAALTGDSAQSQHTDTGSTSVSL